MRVSKLWDSLKITGPNYRGSVPPAQEGKGEENSALFSG